MARVKLTEYRAKKLLLGDTYQGVALYSSAATPSLPNERYVIKVDQGVKKRFKQGLVALDQNEAGITGKIQEWGARGFSQFIAEPMLTHEESEERYLSLERVRGGIRVLYAREGGIDIEAHPEAVRTIILASEQDAEKVAATLALPSSFFISLIEAFNKNYFAFLEINPLVVRDDQVFLLDAAALVDSAAQFFTSSWNDEDVVKTTSKHAREAAVEALAATTAASLKLNVINPDGSIFFLLSGGGGSIVIADEAQARGAGKDIANYGEYSGGPTREETYLYAKEVIGLMLESKAPKKALVIAGGVANFTDVKATFAGIIDVLTESAGASRQGNVKVFVRRGGPNEEAGLAHMRTFLEKEQLLGSVEGSSAVITSAIDQAIDYLHV